MTSKRKNICKVFLLVLFCFWACHGAGAAYILKQGDKLDPSGSLVSKNGLFTLGFFSPSSSEDSIKGWYLGVWFTGDGSNPFWVANRDRPIADNSGALVIDDAGTLMITFTGGDPIKLYSNQSKTSLTANLTDDGNFELREANSDGILWQSFDSPTDSFLPGMKLGIILPTHQRWSLTSWLSDHLPTPGAFSLEWNNNISEFVIKRRGEIFWTSGTFSFNNFENILLGGGVVNHVFIINPDKDERYLTYTISPNQYTSEDKILVTRFWLFSDGTLVDQITSRVIISPEICDGNWTESGCWRWKGPACRGYGEKFEKRVLRNNDNNSRSFDYKANLSLSDCKDICWKDCDCVGVQAKSPNSNGTGCAFLTGPLTEMANGQEETFYIIIKAPSGNESISKWIWISIAVAATLLVILFVGIFLFFRWRKIRLEEKFLLQLMSEAKELEIEGKKGVNLKVYGVSAIKEATHSFSYENKLGEGGFGPVYKGLLPDGQEIAIKRLSGRSKQGLEEFKNELIIVAKLQHTNLVRLLGFCIQAEEKILVYEYMPNKSLDSYIFDQSKRELFDWKKCLNIIEEIAQGLLYLHKYSRLTVIHRDLKAGNILLDKNMDPKISDFGMAKILTTSQSEANTNRIAGTRGYMPPEYAIGGIFSVKSDVFSFGVLMLEILSGRRSNSVFHFDQPLNLVGYAWRLWKEGAAIELIHPTIQYTCSEERVLRCINVALLCVEEKPVDRPSMSVVIYMLTNEGLKLPTPKQPAFSNICGTTMEVNSSKGKAENCSKNSLTITVMDGR